MRKILFCTLIAISCYGLSHAVDCVDIMFDVDTTNSYQLDVDGDGTNDYLFFSNLTPYINSYIIGLNGNEIEVEWGVNTTRANRLVAGNPIGTLTWNDTAYTIKDGQGDFAGGSEEFGWVGLKLYKGGNWHYAFVEVRSPYSQPIISIYRVGYDAEAGSPLNADDCTPTSVIERNRVKANVIIASGTLQVSLGSFDIEQAGVLQLVNLSGQILFEEKLQAQESRFPSNTLQSGVYFATILVDKQVAYRTKVLIP